MWQSHCERNEFTIGRNPSFIARERRNRGIWMKDIFGNIFETFSSKRSFRFSTSTAEGISHFSHSEALAPVTSEGSLWIVAENVHDTARCLDAKKKKLVYKKLPYSVYFMLRLFLDRPICRELPGIFHV